MKMPERAPKMVAIPSPRAMQAEERALLDFLMSHPLAREELRAQGATVQVVSECECGCRSVGLEPRLDAPTAPYTAQDSAYGRDDWIALRALGRGASVTEIELTLHIIFGRMSELEIWDGWDPERAEERAGELPELKTLRYEAQ